MNNKHAEFKFNQFKILEKKRESQLKQLRYKLENPYLLANEKVKTKNGPKRQFKSIDANINSDSNSDNEDQKTSNIKINFKDKKFKKKPIVKLINATQHINQEKRKINKNL